MTTLQHLAPTLIGVLVLVVLTTAVLWIARVPRRFAPALAILRGAVQLAVLSVILSGIITAAWLVAVALVVMFGVAAVTASRRLGWSWQRFGQTSSAMAVGIVVPLAIVFATGALEFSPRYLLAIGGIVIGNVMTIATLAGRNFVSSVNDRWDEVEGWMALGAPPRRSTLDEARASIYSALIPTTDQTKTTGLVALPGAFVGAIFGGVSPLEAGRFQIVVLASIMAAGAITAVAVIRMLGAVTVRPTPLR